MIQRDLKERLLRASETFPVVTVTGPRQSGKTTLCRATFSDRPRLNLEDPQLRTYAAEDPRGLLNAYPDGAMIDEVQRVPELLSYIQAEVDERPDPGRYVLTGSANLQLLESVTQSLAGRTALLTLLPCSWSEIQRFDNAPTDIWEALWSGSYPAVFDRRVPPQDWYAAYVGTYVERDVRRVLNVTDLTSYQTFLRLAAGRTAQLLNLSSLGGDVGVSHNTARSWLSVLETTYIAHRLPPFHASWVKRHVKAPKLLFWDTGLACYLLGIRSPEQLRVHPLRGALFETWVAAEVCKARLHRGQPTATSFYRDRRGLEVDLLVERGMELIAVESKSGETIPSDAFAHVSRLRSQVPVGREVQTMVSMVVYGGILEQQRSAGLILPWSEVPAFRWWD